MDKVLVSKFEGRNISSSIGSNGMAWFKGVDVALALGYKHPHKAICNHVESNEEKKVKVHLTYQNSKSSSAYQTMINEPGLYRLIFSSKLESAERFKTWVFTKVLPSLRKNLS